ncbi:type II toxin-antitoxin system VapC family toxin [Thiothrix unzii]|uniref:Type II toxin-antitoxin system VapC family toxin n=1 Tax=Thiothrix unzii TaxID=111769 RepID=A0A975F9I1_9GAMM|nr:type II toxin-antitoxin system VapC family toxin [Thiothrix unzii]QTR53905.1 type II toxin-antitoxin system VapC family toxin [Thiothrix unzii]
MRYLLDTNILSEQTKPLPDPNVISRLELDGIFACTSATVWHELWHGIHLMPTSQRQQELTDYMTMLVEDGLEILPFCQHAAEWLAQERVRLKRLGLTPSKYDSEIAAVAIVNHLTIVTRNVDDFASFADVRVENWFGL